MSSIFVHMQVPEDRTGAPTQAGDGLTLRMAISDGKPENRLDASCNITGGKPTDRELAMERLTLQYDADLDTLHPGPWTTHAVLRLRDVALFRAIPLMDAVIEQRDWMDHFFVKYEGTKAFMRIDLPESFQDHLQERVRQVLQGMARISDPQATATLRKWNRPAPVVDEDEPAAEPEAILA